MKNQLSLISLIIILGLALATLLNLQMAKQKATKEIPLVAQVADTLKPNSAFSIAGKTYQVQIVTTPAEQAKGLGNIQHLAVDEGMLFIFPKYSTPKFWMKDMRISIDLYWIRDGQIVGVEKHLQPPAAGTQDKDLPTYSPPVPIDQVLEVAAN
jgi:uncharacterized membrane protein (UPF0127 family)